MNSPALGAGLRGPGLAKAARRQGQNQRAIDELAPRSALKFVYGAKKQWPCQRFGEGGADIRLKGRRAHANVAPSGGGVPIWDVISCS